MTKDELPKIYAHFRADYLHALRSVLDDIESDLIFHRGTGLMIEPAPDGGVLLIASNGCALAVLHDPNGKANKPFRAMLPPQFRARCAPPTPVHMFLEGPYEMEPPEWMQPGCVILNGLSAMLFPKMSHPSIEAWEDAPAMAYCRIETGNVWRVEDYRIDEGPLVDWRKVLDRPAANREIAFLSPAMLAQFQPIVELYATMHDGIGSAVAIGLTTADSYPFLVTVKELPNFIGAVMPMRAFEVPPLPDFLRRPAAAEEKAQ